MVPSWQAETGVPKLASGESKDDEVYIRKIYLNALEGEIIIQLYCRRVLQGVLGVGVRWADAPGVRHEAPLSSRHPGRRGER